MGIIKATIGATDVSAYLKGFTVSPGSAGGAGRATLKLDQQAGGLDIRARMDVKIWVPFNTATGAGVANRGRLFGGLVAERATGNIATTKTWNLTCEDYNSLFDLIQRPMQPVSAITLSAGTFGTQLISLVQQIQFNGGASVNQAIDASTGNSLSGLAMPAVVMEPGHPLGWYVQYLCNSIKRLFPGTVPRFFLGNDTTFGGALSFGGPVLWVFDYALSPPAAFSFSDAPTGSQKYIYGQFKRTTNATGAKAIQRRQGRWGTTVYTSSNDTSQGLYPNPYQNHGKNPGGNSGYWGAAPIQIQATSSAEAQAVVDSSVASTAFPTDTYEWETEERVQPYDPIELT